MIEPGQIWRSTNTRRHNPQLYRVIRQNGRTIQVRCITRGSRQHKDRTYTMSLPAFLVKHELIARSS